MRYQKTVCGSIDKPTHDQCLGSSISDGKCKECDYRAEAYQRVRRNDTQFSIGCDRSTSFIERKTVNDCSNCVPNECDNCDNCDNNPQRKPVQCRSGCVSKSQLEKFTRKRVQKTVMLSSSEYLMNKSALTVSKDRENESMISEKNSQASDRKRAAVKTSDIKTRNYSSTYRTRLSLRPGALAPGGTGVDVKHNSYARYLAKKKGRNALRGKGEKEGVVSRCNCPEVFV